jgi:AcrR family transcriptional regulator
MSSQKSTPAPALAREPQRERGKLRVAALLDAGAALFAEKGYGGATMTEIAARAGAAIGSLYQFFPSKEALADALLADYSARTSRALDQIAARAASLSAGGVADALVDLMLEFRAHRAVVVALIDARGDLAGERAALRNAMLRRIETILRAANPGLRRAKAETMAIMILHVLKAVPGLAEEEEEGEGRRLVAEARETIRLYVAHRTGRGER